MHTSAKRAVLLVLAVVGALGIPANAVLAQIRNIPSGQQMFPSSPWQMAPALNQAQYLSNLMANAQLMQQMPPWMYGSSPFYNPMVAGGIGINPYTTSLAASYANPYFPGASGFSNPYTTGGFGGGFGGSGSMLGGMYYGTYIPPTGFFLMGTAQILQAYPNVIKGNEEARILRQQYYIARIEKKKRRLEYELWVKANTPTYTEEQAKVAKALLKRIQSTSNPSEIWSGSSLNILLNDLRKFQGKKVSFDSTLSEETLKHVNVTKSFGNLGLLRDNGRFTWPPALNSLLKPEDRKEIELQAQGLVTRATNGNVPGDVLKELQDNIDNVREKLLKKVNEIPTSQYIMAKRFLNDFNSACLALERGDAVEYFNFQKWISGGKTVQEVVDKMVEKGLKFAPAVQGDEGAYQAMHSALAAYDIAFNTQMSVASAKE